jgi:2-dehydropantoate 2-reductase
MRFAVVGAGGVGGYFGGRLAQAGERVSFLARGAHLEALKSDGLRVESVAGDFDLRPVDATDSAVAIGAVDVVLVCVKAWQVGAVAVSLGPLLGPETVVVPLQNGVEAADALAAVVGEERVLGGLCKILSYIVAPGWVRHAGVAPRIEIGERRGGPSPRVGALREALERCVGVAVGTPEDIEVALWEKFLFIAPVSAVGAASRMPVGVVRGEPEVRRLLEEAMREVVVVGRARGVALRDDIVERTLRYVDGLPADATASMQRDLLEGRPSELDYQTGAVVRLARAAGIRVPVHEFLYAILAPGERGARRQAAC